MGKTKGVVWKHFTDKKGDPAFTCCNYCKKGYKKNATRQSSHIIKCMKVPAIVKQKFKKSVSQNYNLNETSDCEDDSDVEIEENASNDAASSSVPTPLITVINQPSIKKPSTISSFADKISSKQSETLDKKLALAIYVSGSPLNFSEMAVWQDFIKEIRPAYKMPSRYQLSNKLLENEFQNVQKTVMAKVKEAPILTLQTDAWSNIRNDSITNYIINTPTPVFYKSVHTKEEKHTGIFLASEIKKIFDELGAEKFLGLVSDNGSNIKLARELIAEEYSHIVEYGCICHALNLLIGNCNWFLKFKCKHIFIRLSVFIGDICKLPSILTLKKSVTSIICEIKNSQLLHAVFEKIQMDKKKKYISLKLPVDTRWNSFVTSLESMITTKFALQSLVFDDDAQQRLSANVKKMILDDDVFWTRVMVLQKVLTPIAKWTTVFESDHETISKVFECYFEIRSTIENSITTLPILKKEEKNLEKIIALREEKSLRPVHLAANLLDPKFKGNKLSVDQQLTATEFIYNLSHQHPKYTKFANQIIEDLAFFKAEHGLFGKEFVKKHKNMPGVTWWAGICSTTRLSLLAVDILSLPASSASTERSFST